MRLAVPVLAAAVGVAGLVTGHASSVSPGVQAAPAPTAAVPVVTASGSSLLLDGKPRFLLGISHFDALGSVAPADRDLDALARLGISVIRAWAHWREPIYGADGLLTPAGRERLLALTDRLGKRGMVLELVVLRPGQLPGQRFALFKDEGSRREAVQDVTRALKGRGNVIFDLYNEHDHQDGPIEHAALRVMRDGVKAIDPGRLVTVSSTERHIVNDQNVVSGQGQDNLAGEIGTGEGQVAVDLLAPHLPRTGDWADRTDERVEAVRAAMKAVGRTVPVYLNEEQRARDGKVPPSEAYLTAATNARAGGAAGWLLHTEAGFDASKRSLLDALLPPEMEALKAIKRVGSR